MTYKTGDITEGNAIEDWLNEAKRTLYTFLFVKQNDLTIFKQLNVSELTSTLESQAASGCVGKMRKSNQQNEYQTVRY